MIVSASDNIFQKRAATWVDYAPHPECGCMLKQMKQMVPNLPVQGWMIDHRPHGGRVMWKVTDRGVAKERGKARNATLAERDMLDAYQRVQGGGP